MFIRTTLFVAALMGADALSVESKAGRKLMSKARALNEERDVTFVAKYDIKYQGCAAMTQIGAEADAEEGLIYTAQMVKFSLCPSEDMCGSCSGGADYVVNMMDFVDAYTEQKMNALEQACETIRENCYCNNQYQDEDACENQCFTEAEMTECIQYDGDEEYDVQEFLECAEMPNENGNNNNGNQQYNGDVDNYYGPYYVGPYCAADGFSIFVGVFYDMGCSIKADDEVFGNYNYGAVLPFSTEPMVESDCISCQQVDDNDGNNNAYYQELEVSEMCEAVYEQSAKCESNLDINWKDTSGCEYIKDVLPRLESAMNGSRSRSSGGAAVGLAWLFAITTILAGSYAFFLYRKLDRNRVDLSSSDGALA